MSIQIQHKIRQNAMEMREYMTDLYDWEQEMEMKEKVKANLKKQEKLKSKEVSKNAEQQIRVQKTQQNKKEQVSKEPQNKQKKVNLVRDVNTVADYYKAWDKFDVDKEINKLEEQEQRAYRPYNPYQDSKNNLRAKPKTRINVSGRRAVVNDPTELKDKGNLHFQTLEFDKAISCYTQCLTKLDEENIEFDQLSQQKKKLRGVVLSNRSMAYLKIQQTVKALNDANESLRYNPTYSKSYYRRAECLKKLGKYKESLKDFKIVKKLEPNETKAENQIKKIELFLAKRAKQTRESLVIEYNESLMMGSRRIEIQQIAEFAEQQKKKQSNYLDEL